MVKDDPAVSCQKMLRNELVLLFESFKALIDKMQVPSQGLSSDRTAVFSFAPPQGMESEDPEKETRSPPSSSQEELGSEEVFTLD